MDEINLGTCCECPEPAVGIVCVAREKPRGSMQSDGWGCSVCNLPDRGAIAVLCASCGAKLTAGTLRITTIVVGRAGENIRAPIEACGAPFDHDHRQHEILHRAYAAARNN